MSFGSKACALATVILAACSGSEGKQGPQGAQGDRGPAGLVSFGTTAGTAAEGDDPRLSDARPPVGGSTFYIQNGTTPQAASLSIAGGGTFGDAVTAARFVGDGSGLTSLDAARLAAGTLPDARLSANVPLLDGTGHLSAAELPAAVPLLDGTGRVSAAILPVAVLPRTATTMGIGQNGSVTISGFSAPPAVTVWYRSSAGKWTDATGNASFPVEYDPSTGALKVTNGGALIVDLSVVATGP